MEFYDNHNNLVYRVEIEGHNLLKLSVYNYRTGFLYECLNYILKLLTECIGEGNPYYFLVDLSNMAHQMFNSLEDLKITESLREYTLSDFDRRLTLVIPSSDKIFTKSIIEEITRRMCNVGFERKEPIIVKSIVEARQLVDDYNQSFNTY